MTELFNDIKQKKEYLANQSHFYFQLAISNSHRVTTGYIIFLISILMYYMLSMPIQMGDTDMWYHLNGGRYFLETGNIPNIPFFSFIAEGREWTNYFWGFQTLIYSIYSVGGYPALIVFKALLVLISVIFVTRIITNTVNNKEISSAQLVMLALVVFVLVTRATQVRPHLISYTMIPAFIYILYYRPKYIPVLPFLTIIWVNLHGVEWPVGAVIAGGFIIERLYDYSKHNDKRALTQIAWVSLCLPAMLINPNGMDIFFVPFKIPDDINLFIIELRDVSIYTTNLISNRGALLLLFIFSFISIFILGFKHTLKLGQLIMALSGMALLLKGQRFVWEWLLLSLPLFSAASQQIFTQPVFKNKRLIASISIIFILLIPAIGWLSLIQNFKQYPYNTTQLPTATTDFIKFSGIKGSYVAPSNYGGYVQWELYPDILIHSDMEFPPFDAMSYYELTNTYKSKEGLEYILTKYNPDFISVERNNAFFQGLAKNSEILTPISFDERLALYINNKKHPGLADKFRLTAINPFKLHGSDKNLKEEINELNKLLIISPNNLTLLVTVSIKLILAKEYKQALTHAEKLLNLYPRKKHSHFLAAIIHKNLNNYKQAIKYFEKSLNYSNKKGVELIYRHLAESYFQIDEYRKSYNYYKKGFNPYTRIELPIHYFKYAYSAMVVGDIKLAKRLFNMFILYKRDVDEALIKKSRELLSKIERGKISGTWLF